jgi:hypothetical protein
MPRYFLHLRDGTDELLDPDGKDYSDLPALHAAVMANARDCIAGDVRIGIIDLRYRIDAEDADRKIVYTLHFEHAFSLIPRVA